MNTEPTLLEGTNQAKRSIVAVLLTIALLAIAMTFIVDGALRAVTLIAAIAAIIAAFRGLPDSLIEIASRRRGSTYLKSLSFIVPIASLLLSIYLAWLFWSIQTSDLLGRTPVELVLLLIIVAGLLNLSVLAINAFASD